VIQPLLEATRKASLSAVWSQGVKLARENAVTRASRAPGELTLRVRSPGFAIAPTVTLYFDELEWSCDCGGRVDPCAHVTAAVIAVAAEGDRAPDTAPAETQAHLVYRLGVKGRLLTLARLVVFGDGRSEPLDGPLASEVVRGRLPPGLQPTHDDLRLDRILGTPAREVIPLARIADVLGCLSDAKVIWNDATVRASREPVVPTAVVRDDPGGGFVLRVERNAEITEVVSMGVARCNDTLRPLGETDTTGEMLERLPLSRTFGPAAQTELVTSVIPELEKKLVVTIETERLPTRQTTARPRIEMDLSHHGHTLSLLPTLVYGNPPIARVDGNAIVLMGRHVPVRRPEEERALLQRLRDDLHLVPGRRIDLDGTEAVRFASRLRAWQKQIGDPQAGLFHESTLKVRVGLRDGVLDVAFEVDSAGSDGARPGRDDATDQNDGASKHADPATVVRAWKEGLDMVPLEGGGWAPLPVEWLSQHGHRLADLLAAKTSEGKLQRAALAELGALFEALNLPKPLEVERLAPLIQGFTTIPSVVLPPGIEATLRPYQKEGYDWLSFLRDAELGAVLADDMGLGKTLQTICVLRGRCLVICPKSVVHNWALEIARFRPSLKTATYLGTKRELDPRADVTLTTYAFLRMDAERLAQAAWDVVVLDEAQAIKNETSQTAQAAFGLRAPFRVALSGTPVENRLEELWSLMHFANPGLLGGRSDFQERYAGPIALGEAAAGARLRTKIRPFILRRSKREVIPELPARTDCVLHVELDETERAVYDAVRAATRKELTSKLAQGGGVLAALEALLRLRQAACHSALVPGQSAQTSSKVERLLESLAEAADDGHKALVFSQWTSLLDLVEPHLRAAGIPFIRLDGSTRDRGEVVATFQSDAGPPVMLISLKAGGTGLNLTAADHVFLLDPWWNPAVEDQAADRAHRIGQDRPVMVYRMVAKDTVEERIFALKDRKRMLANVALAGAVQQASALTRDDLLALLE
jgi:superfamily II DNA or RNA helicase